MATLADQALAGRPARVAAGPLAPLVTGLQRHGATLLRAGTRLGSADLLVDLGDRIGSRRWWRGLLLLGVLTGATLSLGLRQPVILGQAALPYQTPGDEAGQGTFIASLAEGSSTGTRAAPTRLVHQLAETPERPRIELSTKIGADGLLGSLRRAGVGKDDLAAVKALWARSARGAAIPRGTALSLVLGRREDRHSARPLQSLAFRAAFEWQAEVTRLQSGDLSLKRLPLKVDYTPLRVTGVVGSSFDRSARAAGLPQRIVNEFRQQLGNAIDLRRDLHRGDRFDIVVANRRAETGESEMGQLLFAGLTGEGRNIQLMRWGKSSQFFHQNGEGVIKGLIRTPITGARRSSGFGMRFHPILGYSRMHKGTDFAAGTGTPIRAAGPGRVVHAGRMGGYGNLVEIDHGKGLHTRYAHMSRIDVKVGQKVDQGQTVGAVGSTGLATGPHLHYEVWQNGNAVNPDQARYTGGVKLSGAELGRFKAEMRRLEGLKDAGRVSARG